MDTIIVTDSRGAIEASTIHYQGERNVLVRNLRDGSEKRYLVKLENGRISMRNVDGTLIPFVGFPPLQPALPPLQPALPPLQPALPTVTFHQFLDRYLAEMCPVYHLINDIINKEMIEVFEGFNSDGLGNGLGNGSEHERMPRTLVGKRKIVKGYMQSMKTWTIISTALCYLIKHRVSVFIILRNYKDDIVQIMERFTNELIKMVSQAGLYGDNVERKARKLEAYVIRTRIATIKHLPEKMEKILNGEKPRILFCIRNDDEITRINDLVDNASSYKYVVLMDEADNVDGDNESLVRDSMDTFLRRASSVWGVTATALGPLLKDDIESGNVIVLGKPENYKDVHMFEFKQLALPCIYGTRKEHNLLLTDPNLSGYLQNLSTKSPIPWVVGKHPVISLIRAGSTIESHKRLANDIDRLHGDKITVLTYDSSQTGITLRGNGTHFFTNSRVHNFSNSHISSILGELQHIGVDRFPRIAIIVGNKADRGISFVSSLRSVSEQAWHLTEMYMIVSGTTRQPDLLQIAGRLCGVFKDNIRLTMYSNACEDIKKAYNLQEELIARAKELQEPMKKSLLSLPISKEKVPKKREMTSLKTKPKPRTVEDDGKLGGWNWETKFRNVLLEMKEKKEEKKEEKEDFVSSSNISTNIRLVDEKSINKNTNKYRIYLSTLKYMSSLKGQWIDRPTVIDFVHKETKIVVKSINAEMTNLFNNHCFPEVVNPNQPGLLIEQKQTRSRVSLRYN